MIKQDNAISSIWGNESLKNCCQVTITKFRLRFLSLCRVKYYTNFWKLPKSCKNPHYKQSDCFLTLFTPGWGQKWPPPCVFSKSFLNGKRYHSAIVGKLTEFYCRTFAKNRMSISRSNDFLLVISQGEVSLFFHYLYVF